MASQVEKPKAVYWVSVFKVFGAEHFLLQSSLLSLLTAWKTDPVTIPYFCSLDLPPTLDNNAFRLCEDQFILITGL